MFNIKQNECVGFESRWKVIKVTTESTTQTSDFSTCAKGTSTTGTSSTEVQTDEQTSNVTTEADMEKLAQWLKKIYPKVEKEMDDVTNSKVFEGYRLQSDLGEANCKLIQNINVAEAFHGGSGDKISRISNITWNQTGKSIAISCNSDHSSWCYHTGCVAIFTLDRDGKLPETPRKKLTTESCVTNLKFHPNHPAILAAGTYSGGIYIWNIQNDEEDVLKIETIHSEAVTQISWIHDYDVGKSILLATSSTDGYLKLWNFNLNNLVLDLKVRYIIKIPLFATILKNKERKSISEKVTEGIVCFDFSRHVPELFVVGLEGGLIAQCSTLGAFEIKDNARECRTFDPFSKYYEPHDGQVTSISFSPNRSEMFMTYGTDSEVRIYLIGQEEPAQVIFIKENLTDITFVPYEEKLIAGCGCKGTLEIFHLQKGRSLENITTEEVKKSTLTKIAINSNKTNIVAMGNTNGEIQLWSVPWIMFSVK